MDHNGILSLANAVASLEAKDPDESSEVLVKHLLKFDSVPF